jgi:hypothetical protein
MINDTIDLKIGDSTLHTKFNGVGICAAIKFLESMLLEAPDVKELLAATGQKT